MVLYLFISENQQEDERRGQQYQVPVFAHRLEKDPKRAVIVMEEMHLLPGDSFEGVAEIDHIGKIQHDDSQCVGYDVEPEQGFLVALFLPEAEGENPFSDVTEKDYFYDAVLWAVENEITTGSGEGKFSLPGDEKDWNVVLKYSHEGYPANPNGSDFATAGICSADGRHLAMMPHLERAFYPWQCGCYPESRRLTDEVTPWIEAFVNAREWVKKQKQGAGK